MKIAVSAWSYHVALYAGKLRQSDVPAEVAALGLRHVELMEMFLWRKPPGILQRVLRRARGGAGAPATATADSSRETLNELRGARLRAGTQLVCWAIDTDLTAADADARREQLAHIGRAVEVARFLGGPLLRITTGGQESDLDTIGRVVEALRAVLPAAMASGVKLAIENHFGLSADPHALAEIIQAVHSPHVGVCLDLGNFREGEAEQGIRALAPHTIHVHAKSYSFSADGEETKINYRAAMEALRAAGYDGVLSIEFEGDGAAADGIRKTRNLIEKYWNR